MWGRVTPVNQHPIDPGFLLTHKLTEINHEIYIKSIHLNARFVTNIWIDEASFGDFLNAIQIGNSFSDAQKRANYGKRNDWMGPIVCQIPTKLA